MRAKLWPPSQGEGQVVRVAGFLVEVRAPLEQFEHALGPFFDDDAHGLVVAQARARRSRCRRRAIRTESERLKHRGDAALGVPGVGLLDGVLGEQQNIRARLRRRDRGAQARRRRRR